MNQTAKLAALASLLAASALAAGCVPSLNYGSVPPEPKYTTKVTTTTATGATTKPFTTPKPRTGTISWEELNGPLERSVRSVSTEAVYTGYASGGEGVVVGGGFVKRGGRSDEDNEGHEETPSVVQADASPAATEAPAQQTAAPQTEAPLQQVEGPPPQQAEPQPAPEEPAPTPQPGPPPEEPAADFPE